MEIVILQKLYSEDYCSLAYDSVLCGRQFNISVESAAPIFGVEEWKKSNLIFFIRIVSNLRMFRRAAS